MKPCETRLEVPIAIRAFGLLGKRAALLVPEQAKRHASATCASNPRTQAG
jgi:hypothetical protein